MKRVTFELSDELHKKLKLLCYTESVSIGHILRECVTDFCNKHDFRKVVNIKFWKYLGAVLEVATWRGAGDRVWGLASLGTS